MFSANKMNPYYKYFLSFLSLPLYLHCKWISPSRPAQYEFISWESVSLSTGQSFLWTMKLFLYISCYILSTLGPSPSGPYLTSFLYWVNLIWSFLGLVPFLLVLEWEALLATRIFTLCWCVLKYNFFRDHFSGHLIKKNQFYPHDLLISILFPTIFSIKTLIS